MKTRKAVTRKKGNQSVLFTMLKKDHKLFKDLFKKAEKKRSDDTFEKIKAELEVHMIGEEDYFYPLLKGDSSMEAKALEALEEHDVGRYIVGLIHEEEEDKIWLARIKVLKDVVEHHIEEEEEEVFPEASKKIDRQELDEAAEKFKGKKKK